MRTDEKLNMTMLCDFYELTMANGYFESGYADRITYFDAFFRTVPDKGGFAITAGLEQLIDYIEDLHFTEEDIAYLRGRHLFSEKFLDYLRNFKFTGDVWAIPEGTPVFPREPMVTVRARAAYIAGCVGTACTISDQLYGTPALGTMAHAWVQMFDSEYDAFKTYCELYPTNATLLVDTYNTLKSGIPNAIRAFNEVLKPKGITKCGIRLDSGDIAYLTREARKMLDDAGWETCKITVSNSLDEWLIRDLWLQEAKIDAFGVGERLITAKSEPVFGGVYKLVAVEDDKGEVVPKIKISENVGKITTPHFKKVYRLYDRESGKAIADYLCVHDETLDDTQPLTLFDPEATWKRKTVRNYTARELLTPIYRGGKLVYERPSLDEIKQYCAEQVDTFWGEYKRFENPQTYYVDLSQKLYDIRQDLLHENGSRND